MNTEPSHCIDPGFVSPNKLQEDPFSFLALVSDYEQRVLNGGAFEDGEDGVVERQRDAARRAVDSFVGAVVACGTIEGGKGNDMRYSPEFTVQMIAWLAEARPEISLSNFTHTKQLRSGVGFLMSKKVLREASKGINDRVIFHEDTIALKSLSGLDGYLDAMELLGRADREDADVSEGRAAIIDTIDRYMRGGSELGVEYWEELLASHGDDSDEVLDQKFATASRINAYLKKVGIEDRGVLALTAKYLRTAMQQQKLS